MSIATVLKSHASLAVVGIAVLAAGVLLAARGCDPRARDGQDLAAVLQIGSFYFQFTRARGRPPKSAEELLEFDPYPNTPGGGGPENWGAKKALRTARYEVAWGTSPAATGETLLVWTTKSPRKGGTVFFTTGRAAVLTKDQFAKYAGEGAILGVGQTK